MSDDPNQGSGGESDPKSETRPLPKVDAPVASAEGDSDEIDVKGMIQQASRRVSVDALVKKGRKTISMMSQARIQELISQAVRTMLKKYKGGEPLEGVDIEKEAKEDFNELLKQYQDSNKAKTDLESGRQSLMQELEEMQRELEQQKRISEGKIDEEAETMLLVGFKEFESELDRVFKKVYEKRKMILGEDEVKGQKELETLAARLRIVIGRLVETERSRFAGSHAKDREIAVLEKRISKLYEQMKSMESALQMISNQKVFSNAQIGNLLRELGLAPEDEAFKKKKEMLKIVAEQNIALRKEVKERRDRGEDVNMSA